MFQSPESRCATVVELVFLLAMSKSDPAPLMPVRRRPDARVWTVEQRGGAVAVQEAEQEQQLAGNVLNAGGQNAFRERSERVEMSVLWAGYNVQ